MQDLGRGLCRQVYHTLFRVIEIIERIETLICELQYRYNNERGQMEDISF